MIQLDYSQKTDSPEEFFELYFKNSPYLDIDYGRDLCFSKSQHKWISYTKKRSSPFFFIQNIEIIADLYFNKHESIKRIAKVLTDLPIVLTPAVYNTFGHHAKKFLVPRTPEQEKLAHDHIQEIKSKTLLKFWETADDEFRALKNSKISKGHLSYWSEMDEDLYRQRCITAKEAIAKMSEEDLKLKHQRIREGVKENWSEVSQETREQWREANRNSQFLRWSTTSEEDRKKFTENMINWRKDLSDEELQEFNEKYTSSTYLYKDYVLKSGEVLRIQGYEDKTLKILEDQGFTDLKTRGNIFSYVNLNTGKKHHHFPDLLVNGSIIIETKSWWTLKGSNSKIWRYKSILTHAIENGYIYEFWIHDTKSKDIIIIDTLEKFDKYCPLKEEISDH